MTHPLKKNGIYVPGDCLLRIKKIIVTKAPGELINNVIKLSDPDDYIKLAQL